MSAASLLPGEGSLMWWMPLHLHVNQKHDDDDHYDDDIALDNSKGSGEPWHL